MTMTMMTSGLGGWGCACVTTLSFVPHKTTPTSSLHLPFLAPTPKNINTSLPHLSSLRLLFTRECEPSLTSIQPSSQPNWAVFDISNDYQYDGEGEFIVVNFYRFVFIKHPQQEVSKHLSFLQDRDIHGRIYLNEQGINAQYSGPSKDALAYVTWLREDHRFSDILVQISPAIQGHAFPKLKLRYKPSLVQLEGGISHLPLLDSSMRAMPLTPAEWRNRLEAVNKVDIASNATIEKDFILLDVRNGYEWDIGHFRGAQRPDVDCFRSTSFGLSRSEAIASDPLANANKEKTQILMYCTGGIRCDVYSAILRETRSGRSTWTKFDQDDFALNSCMKAIHILPDVCGRVFIRQFWMTGLRGFVIKLQFPGQRGFRNLYTLKGGVSHYLQSEGAVEWIGNLFVFDSRLSLPPPAEEHDVAIEEIKIQEASSNSKFAKCYICGLQISELRHRNCANPDCNLLFLCCKGCMEDVKGCCSLKCTSAPRLRPILPGHQRYAKWHHYRDQELQTR